MIDFSEGSKTITIKPLFNQMYNATTGIHSLRNEIKESAYSIKSITSKFSEPLQFVQHHQPWLQVAWSTILLRWKSPFSAFL